MCGFAVLSTDYCQNTNLSGLRKVMAHRGPDDFQVKDLGFCQLFFWRLSIQDLKHGGQPVASQCGRFTSVMNGEVYNFLDLRKELLSKGILLESKGDAEVIPNLFSLYGDSFIERINGMFSIVIIDHETKEVRSYRDRSGTKPLYWYHDKGKFIFSSELRIFRAFQDRILGEQGLFQANYKQAKIFGYFPFEETLLKGVNKLSPASKLKISADNIKKEIYWKPKKGSEVDTSDVENTLREVVHEYLISDVSLGIFLSGGLDSGLVAKFASEKVSNLPALTIDFKDGNGVDAALAKKIAKHFNLQHEVIEVSVEEIINDLPQMIWYLDDINTDSGLLPTFFISKVAKEKGLKVVLSGTGGDEVFGGYNYYRPNHWERRLKTLSLFSHAFPKSYKKNTVWAKVVRSLHFDKTPSFNYLHHKMLFGSELVKGHDEFALRLESLSCDLLTQNSSLQRMELDYKTYLPEQLLAMLDRMTMANSIEGRVPFCDHRVLECARNNPESISLRKNESKPVLRTLAQKHLPREVLRAPKMGFNSPIEAWIEKNSSRILKFSLQQGKVFSKSELRDFDLFNHYQKWAVLVINLYDLIFNNVEYHTKRPEFTLDEVLS